MFRLIPVALKRGVTDIAKLTTEKVSPMPKGESKVRLAVNSEPVKLLSAQTLLPDSVVETAVPPALTVQFENPVIDPVPLMSVAGDVV
jgi:hypothetical protein